MEGSFNPLNPKGTLFGSTKSILVAPLLADDDFVESGQSGKNEESISTYPSEATTLAYKLSTSIENIIKYHDGSSRDVIKTLQRLGLSNLGDALADFGAEEITASQVHEIIFTRKQRTKMQTMSLRVLIWLMPFLYTIVTRLPFICLALEVESRGGEESYWQLSILLGSYQICRAIANMVISKFGGPSPIHRLHIPMIFLSIFGWTMVNEYIIPSPSVFHLFFLCAVGLSECVLNLQTAVANETSAEYPSGIADKDVLESRIRGQYAAVAGGAAVAFVAGGQLYELGFGEVCWFGLACSLLHLCLAVFYRSFCLYKYKTPVEGDATQSPLKSCYQIIALSYLIGESGTVVYIMPFL